MGSFQGNNYEYVHFLGKGLELVYLDWDLGKVDFSGVSDDLNIEFDSCGS